MRSARGHPSWLPGTAAPRRMCCVVSWDWPLTLLHQHLPSLGHRAPYGFDAGHISPGLKPLAGLGQVCQCSVKTDPHRVRES